MKNRRNIAIYAYGLSMATILLLSGCTKDPAPEKGVETSYDVTNEPAVKEESPDVITDDERDASEEVIVSGEDKEKKTEDEQVYSGKYSDAYLASEEPYIEPVVKGIEDVPVESEDDAYELVSYLLGFPREHDILKLSNSFSDRYNDYYDFEIYHDGYLVAGTELRLFVDQAYETELRTTGYDCIYEDMPDFELADILAEAGIDQNVYINTKTIYLLDTESNKAIPCIKCDSESYLEDTLLIDITEKNIRWRHPNIIID